MDVDIITLIGITIALLIILIGLLIYLRRPKKIQPMPTITGAVRAKDAINTAIETQNIAAVNLPKVQMPNATSLMERSALAVQDEDTDIQQQAQSDLASTVVSPSGKLSDDMLNIDASYLEQHHFEQPQQQNLTEDVDQVGSYLSDQTTRQKAQQPVEIEKWQGVSPLLNEHNEQVAKHEQDFSLANADQVYVIYLLPDDYKPFDGAKILERFKVYGLLFGEMNLFHRYDSNDGSGALLFSVLRYSNDERKDFDLDTLAEEKIPGLAFFLAIPHACPQHGFDTMRSIGKLLARDLKGKLYDEEMNILTEERYKYHKQRLIEVSS